ncbi:phosphatidylinositol 3,4,5-trisphosphate 3-phosphatase and protein-tyrosine-phosphatase PTEN2A-like [Chenopodium quinoa]|uniref:phosphatidylinositol 3,4,5-trisphosphate 3-phosphatase and protein-tyrosine-phosphatase PTEN2A-like n=1 Tax=Chenopodium quinoa TaxID=63459 RepID=UPI000B76D0B2|nr:phosphatidylinositol 3,4,5-trisphosphate 3-phosphatase and protein-tyrosine-phosphatase PTEN2A-like [Chenopodium quinoa]
MVFALPGEPRLTELCGDFKVLFHDRQGDFYFWLNTIMIENRKILNTSDMDGFDKRKLPSPGFQVEVVLVDYDGTPPSPTPQPEPVVQKPNDQTGPPSEQVNEVSSAPEASKDPQGQAQSEQQDKDDVFSDDEVDGSGSSRSKKAQAASLADTKKSTASPADTKFASDNILSKFLIHILNK